MLSFNDITAELTLVVQSILNYVLFFKRYTLQIGQQEYILLHLQLI